jgi:transcription elongation GreA/GreB family factor/predicted Zn-dependent protease
MDPISAPTVNGIIKKAICSLVVTIGRKVSNSLFRLSDVEEFILLSTDLEAVIKEEITLENIHDIVNSDAVAQFFRTGEVSDIVRRIYDTNILPDFESENLEDLRLEFSYLFSRHLESEKKEELLALGSQIFNVLTKACNRVLSEAVWNDKSLPAQGMLSSYNARVSHEEHMSLHKDFNSNFHKIDEKLEFMQHTISEELLDDEYKAQLEPIREKLKSKNPTEVLESVQKLEKRIWDKSSSNVKYNLLNLKASANLSLNKHKEAGKLFLEARQYNSEDEKAVVNASFGYLLLEEKSKARELALKILEKNPTNAHAYSILIQTGSDEDVEKIPPYIEENQDVAYALGFYYYKKENLYEAKKWLEISIKNETENILKIRPFLASILIDITLLDPKTIPEIQLDPIHREELEKAVDLLTFAWDSISDKNLKVLHIDWLVKRAIAKCLLSDIKGAETDINCAYELDSSDPKLLHFKALVDFEQGEFEKVVSLFEGKLSTETEVGSLILYFEALRKLGRVANAIMELNEFLDQNPHFENKNNLEELLVYSYLDSGRYDEAQELAESMLKEDPVDIQKIISLARVMRKLGDKDSSTFLLKEAKNKISDSSKFPDLMALANEFLRAELFEESCEVYEAFVDTSQLTELTHRMVEAYYRYGDLEKTLEICKSLRKRFGPIVHITQIEIAIYDEINCLEEEKRVLEEYTEHFPENFDMKLNLALLNYKCTNFDEVDRFLKTPFDVNSLSIESCINLAFLLNERGFFQKAVEALYELRRNNFDNEKVHSAYIKLILLSGEKENEEFLHPKKVGINSAVIIEDPTGKKRNYIIEDRKDADTQKGELKPDNNLAVRLLGKNKGDKVIFKTPVSEEVFEIKEVKSKYIHASQESSSLFNNQFPENQELFQISISKKGDEGISPEGLEKIKEMARLNFEREKKIRKLYTDKKIPIGSIANLYHRSIFDIWCAFTKNSQLGVYCSTGYNEIKKSLEHIKTEPQLIIDPLSILTVVSLDIMEMIKNHFGKLGVAQSTVDLFQQIVIEQNRMNSRSRSILVYHDNNVFMQEVSEESKQKETEKLNSVLKFIHKNCEILPCNRALYLNSKKKIEYNENIGRAFIDTILIAGEKGNVLYSEEKTIRDIAKREFETNGIWTQALLTYCLDNGVIEKDLYNEKTIQLISLNYYHTSINSEILLEAAKKAKWKLAFPFTQTLKVIEGKNCDENSALKLSLDFICSIKKEHIPIEDFNLLFMNTLNLLVEGRWAPSMINKLKIEVTKTFDLFSLKDKIEILELIEVWEMIYYKQVL